MKIGIWNLDGKSHNTMEPFEHDSDCFNRKKVILHIDIDCFYAQVEIKKNPILAGKPIGIQQKNIVVTSNYLARKSGVGKCCSIHDALKSCPELVLVNGEDLADYREESQRIFDLLYESGCNVEKLGMDENFVDVTDLVQERMESGHYGDTLEIIGHAFGQSQVSCTAFSESCACHDRLMIGSMIAKELRDSLLEKLQITSSCGIAHNKLLAKLAGSKFKPNDQTVVYYECQMELMNSLPSIRSIPGLGSATYDLFLKKGILTIHDLQNANASSLSDLIPDAQKFIHLSLGIDHSVVKMNGKPKSIGLEDRFPGISTKEGCIEKVKWLLQRLSKLISKDGRKSVQTLKVFIRDAERDKNDPTRKFAKYSRQSKVSPSSFSTEQSILGHEALVIQLIGKMLDFNR